MNFKQQVKKENERWTKEVFAHKERLREIGQALRRYREEHNCGTKEFAAYCGLSQTHLNSIENGHRKITYKTTIKIEKGLKKLTK
jgi:DNA-binding XRE family transcriptional regulator